MQGWLDCFRQRGVRGIALLETSVTLSMLLPLVLVAAGVWDYVQKTSVVSTIARRGAYSVSVKNNLLSSTEGAVVVTSNLSAIDGALLNSAVKIESEVREAFKRELDTLRIVMVYGVQDLSADPPRYQELLRRDIGDINLSDPFLDAKTTLSLGKNAATSSVQQTASIASKVGLIGVSVAVKPKEGFYSKALSALGGSWIVSDARVVHLRGEYRWND